MLSRPVRLMAAEQLQYPQTGMAVFADDMTGALVRAGESAAAGEQAGHRGLGSTPL
jgi:hypothetical protein